MKNGKKLTAVILALVLFGVGIMSGVVGSRLLTPKESGEVEGVERDKYVVFLEEIKNIVKDNYWKKMEDGELNKLFVLGAEKLTGQTQNINEKDNQAVEKMYKDILGYYDSEEKKKQFAASLADLVLSNLEPFGRSRLYTMKEEKELSDTVQNKNPDVDRYEDLGVEKDASPEVIAQTYKKQTEELAAKAKTDPQAAEKLKKVEEAYKILGDEGSREVYDMAGVEPTMDYKLISGSIFHIHLKKFSPTTFDELQRVVAKAEGMAGVDTLIFDLRDNIGGAIDGLPYFLGPFIGNDMHAYEYFHQGEKLDFKTRVGWLPGLVQYKKVIIMANEGSQSTAELMAASLKKYNVGVLVGTKTKGWGTVERVFKMESRIDDQETHSVFLVHSLTLREDGEPIEGRGVDPVIDLTKIGWEKELKSYFNSEEIVKAVGEIWKN